MPRRAFSNILIKIHTDHENGINTTITSQKDTVSSQLCLPNWPFFEDKLTELGIYHSQRTLELPKESSKQNATREMGGILFDSLIKIPLFKGTYERAIQNNRKLRIVLDIEPYDLQKFPWEFCYDENLSTFLNLDDRFSITRCAPKIQSIKAKRIISNSINLLTIVSNPQGTPALNFLAEKRWLLDAQREAFLEGRNIDITVLEYQSTFQQLQNQIKKIENEKPFHILHFSGHGEFNDIDGGKLLLENEAGQKVWIRASSFSNLFRGSSQLHLALINACESALYRPGDASTGVASALLSAGIPAVIAMITDMKDIAATNFIKGFYSSLFQGQTVDESVTSGRRIIESSSPFSSYWGIPILYLSSPKDIFFRPDSIEAINEFSDSMFFPAVSRRTKQKDKISATDVFITKQRERILNMPIMPWIASQSPSLDFIWPKLFVDPYIKPAKHPSEPKNLSEWKKSNWQFGRNIVICGPAGIGKTTSLISLFLEALSNFESKKSDYIPLFIRAADLNETNTSSIKKLMDYFAEDYGFENLPIPSKLILFIDGVDEVVPEKIIPILQYFLTGPLADHSIYLACRDTYYHDYISADMSLSQRFFEIIELSPWETDISLKFAREYLIEAQKIHLLDGLIEACKVSEVVKLFLSRPFQLTMLLYLLTTEDRLLPAEIKNIYSLYKTFYQSWIRRENARGSSWLPSSVIEGIHRSTAIALYSNKGSSLPLDFITEEARKYDQGKEKLLQDSALISLLEIKKSAYSQTLRIVRFVHETLGEYQVAENLIDCFLKGGDKLDEALSVIYNYEVNAFVREAFELMPNEDKVKILSNLTDLYINLTNYSAVQKEIVRKEIYEGQPSGLPPISSEGGMRNRSTSRREQILYYLGRLPVQGTINVFRFALRHEGVSVLKRIAAISATLQNAFDLEKEYVESLIPNSPEDIENRSIQLVYFGDVDGELGVFQDNSHYPWDNTRRAICERLNRNGAREMRLRWWDLRTLFLFCESRGWNKQLSDTEVETIKNCEVQSGFISRDKEIEIEKEKERILTKCQELLQ